MNRRMRRVIVPVLLAVSLMAAFAASASAIDRQSAYNTAVGRYHWKAACGQGYWTCNDAIRVEQDGPYGGSWQWSFYIVGMRHHNANSQECQFWLDMASNQVSVTINILCRTPGNVAALRR